ncbi:MAG: hypothetical protein M1317_05305 [Candidatus Thermoplasmatota archaeon]|nr:hypothetical protein [Candidatus Thermoplasmatota archaeon]
MNIISTIGKLHGKTVGYSYEDFIRYITESNARNLIVTYTSEENFTDNREDYIEIQMLQEKFNVHFPKIDYQKYYELSEKYALKAQNAEDITKKNITDIIETVIDSYLTGYWKNPETVNSEITDSIFKVKNKFIESVNHDYIEKYWNPLHMEIYKYIEREKNSFDAVITDVESAFFYREKNL